MIAYQDYAKVPWFRRSGVNSWFVVLGGFGPGIIQAIVIEGKLWPTLPGIALALLAFLLSLLLYTTCGNLLTGDIYYNQAGNDGNLKPWSFGNKIVAVVIVLVQIGWLVRNFIH
jgi:hypothetical protein